MRGVYLTNDLMYSSRILAAAQHAGCDLATVMSVAALPERLTGDEPIALAIIDLAAPLGDLAAITSQVRAAAPLAKIVAYGPHVDHARLHAAQAAGCDHVFSRGEFMQVFPQLVARGS